MQPKNNFVVQQSQTNSQSHINLTQQKERFDFMAL